MMIQEAGQLSPKILADGQILFENAQRSPMGQGLGLVPGQLDSFSPIWR